jgi:P-type Cu+ transporter
VKKVAGSTVYAGTINQTGACGFAAGTPLALLGGIGRTAQLGVIIKGGKYLETLGQISTGVLYETGTLTCGRAEVQTMLPAPYITEKK